MNQIEPSLASPETPIAQSAAPPRLSPAEVDREIALLGPRPSVWHPIRRRRWNVRKVALLLRSETSLKAAHAIIAAIAHRDVLLAR